MFGKNLLILTCALCLCFVPFKEAIAESGTELAVIPLISASSDNDVNIGAAAYFFRLFSDTDVSYGLINVSTKSNIQTILSTSDKRFMEFLSYKFYMSYLNTSYTRYYTPYTIQDLDQVSIISMEDFDFMITSGLNVMRYLNIGIGLMISNTRPYETDSAPASEQMMYRRTLSSAGRLYLRIDTRIGDPAAPVYGDLIEFDIDRSDGSLGSDLVFTRYTLKACTILPFPGSLFLVPRFYWESIDGDNLPFYSLPGIGGASKLRSFSQYRFTGNHAMLFGTELRYRFLKSSEKSWYKFFELAAFIDAGNTSETVSGFKAKDMQYSFGGGLRTNISPGIIFRFDYATNAKEHFFYIRQGYPF